MLCHRFPYINYNIIIPYRRSSRLSTCRTFMYKRPNHGAKYVQLFFNTILSVYSAARCVNDILSEYYKFIGIGRDSVYVQNIYKLFIWPINRPNCCEENTSEFNYKYNQKLRLPTTNYTLDRNR